MDLEQAKKAVGELIATVYPANMQQTIMDAFTKAPNAGDPSYWENIRQGLAMQSSGAIQQSGEKKEEGDWSIEVINGNSVKINGYKGNDTIIQIPAQMNGMPVTVIGRRAFRDKKLTGVTIPDSVTSIEDMAFAKNQLTSASLGKGVASIGESAFEGNQLASIDIPNSVTSIGKSAFAKNKLDNITIPGSVTSIGEYAFEENQLTSVTIPDGITSIKDSAFTQNQLASVTIPGSVTCIEADAFSDNKITEINIPDSVASIGDRAFRNNQIAEINIPAGLKTIGKEAFQNNNLTIVTVPDSLKSFGEGAFGDAGVLKADGSVLIKGKAENDYEIIESQDGKSVIITGYKVSKWMKNLKIPLLINGLPVTGIAAKAFYKKDTINVIVPDSVTFIGDEAFAENKIESISIPAGVTSIGNKAFMKSYLASVAIPDSVTSIGDSAFEECRKLESVTLGGGITSIGSKVFRRCNLAAGIIIPSSVTSIGEQAFCQSGLTGLTVKGNIASVGEKAFYDNAISSIDIQGSIENIGKEAFADNESAEGDLMVLYSDDIKSIIVSDYKGKGKELKIPSQIRGLPVTKIYQGVLCSGINSITIPDNVFIGDGITSGNHKIRSVTIGNNVTIGKIAVGFMMGTYFDMIGIEDFIQHTGKIVFDEETGLDSEITTGSDYIPFDKVYNGKAGTLILVIDDKSGKYQWGYKK
ncbi:MAG: leucine-rich repeat domain-containing protein [Treponema sp.]|jgi:hypothetical protein|nr:leucine-rich repeat domain-containing protein [Treponema sp.]